MAAAAPETLDYAALTAAEQNCLSINAAKDASLALKLVCFGEFHILCDVSMQQPRPVIPLDHCWKVFAGFLDMAHPGAKATKRLMATIVNWPAMAMDITT